MKWESEVGRWCKGWGGGGVIFSCVGRGVKGGQFFSFFFKLFSYPPLGALFTPVEVITRLNQRVGSSG